MSLLDAAYDFLKSTGVPMTAQAIVDPILKAGLWTTTGKTPDATLAARIYVDIKKNGEKSRFVKVGNGKFALSGSGALVRSEEPSLFDGMEKIAAEQPAQPVPDMETLKLKSGKAKGQTFSFTDCAEKVLRCQGKRFQHRGEGRGRKARQDPDRADRWQGVDELDDGISGWRTAEGGSAV